MIDANDVITCATAIKQRPGLALGPAGSILTLEVVLELATRLQQTEGLLKRVMASRVVTEAPMAGYSETLADVEDYLKNVPVPQPPKLNLVTA